MSRKLSAVLVVAGGFLAASGSLSAHHSAVGIDDQQHEVTYQTVTVTEFQFANPHTRLYCEVQGANGAAENWEGEMSPANNLRRLGWTRDRLKPGDKIKVVLHVARDGSTRADILDIFVDGKQIYRSRDN